MRSGGGFAAWSSASACSRQAISQGWTKDSIGAGNTVKELKGSIGADNIVMEPKSGTYWIRECPVVEHEDPELEQEGSSAGVGDAQQAVQRGL